MLLRGEFTLKLGFLPRESIAISSVPPIFSRYVTAQSGPRAKSQHAASETAPSTPPNHPGLTSRATTSPTFEWPKSGTRGPDGGAQWGGGCSALSALSGPSWPLHATSAAPGPVAGPPRPAQQPGALLARSTRRAGLAETAIQRLEVASRGSGSGRGAKCRRRRRRAPRRRSRLSEMVEVLEAPIRHSLRQPSNARARQHSLPKRKMSSSGAGGEWRCRHERRKTSGSLAGSGVQIRMKSTCKERELHIRAYIMVSTGWLP